MSDDPRVDQLLEDLLDSGGTPEDACREYPELLPQVRTGWQRVRTLKAKVNELFHEFPFSSGGISSPPPTAELPRVRGYEVREVLGRGGMGIVYKAWHLRLQRPVALKMLLAGAYAQPHESERFLREAETVASLSHANIVQVYEAGDVDGRQYFTMEYVEGGSLAQKLAGTPQPAGQAAALVAAVAEAVHAAHLRGVVHRDLKPGNILLTADGTPKISDFGLARQLDGAAGLTQSGAPLGTPSYMAPEQAEGRSRDLGPAVDTYALGAILYELLTGRPPFRADTAAETQRQVITHDPAPPSRLNGRVPRDLETICLTCLRKEPQSRYATAAALSQDLHRFLRGEAITARPEGLVERLVRQGRRRPVLTIATLSFFVLTGGGLWMISERAGTERVATAEREATEQAARDDLREMADELKNSRWPQARAALERAKGRLGDRGSPESRRLLERGSDDLKLAARMDTIYLDVASHSMPASQRVDEQYTEAFRTAGLGQVSEDAELVADRVLASNIRNALVDALDHWSANLGPGQPRAWALAVARKADPDPSGWRERARDPDVRADKSADHEVLVGVIRDAPVADQRVPLLLALAASLVRNHPERLPFLKRIQQNHASDFWANITLGDAMTEGNPAEALRYFQAAVSIRPDLALGYEKLGLTLGSQPDLIEDALTAVQMAVKLDPMAIAPRCHVVGALLVLGRLDEAADHLREAIGAHPSESAFQTLLASVLEYKGRDVDALTHRRKAAVLNPNDNTQNHLRKLLVRLGQGEEVRNTWQRALEAGAPANEAWCGYTEFCLFLGQDDEYRRVRKSLLTTFGTTTDPRVAGGAARACLLLPGTEEELRQAVVLVDRALAGDRSKYRLLYSHFLFARGLAEYRQGHFDRVIATMSGEVADVLVPPSRVVLAMALYQSGRVAEGREALKAAVLSHDWTTDDWPDPNNWVFNILRREAEGIMLPDLPAFLDGLHQPKDNDERLALLGVCHATQRALSLARLYADIFRDDPNLAEDLSVGHRFNAARAAAQAGCGVSKDSAGLGELERRQWREQAREWLRADLDAWSKLLESRPAKARDQLQKALLLWRIDPALACLREATELEKFSADEQKDCLAFWGQVGLVLAKAPVDR